MKNHLAVIGAFVVSGLLLFTIGLFLIGNRHQAFTRHEAIYIEMATVNGLVPGTKVRVEGFDAGQVKNIELPTRPSDKFRLKLEVLEKLHDLIRQDSLVTVESDGLVGDKFLLIHNGSDGSPEARNGATIASKEPIVLSAVMAKVSGVVDQANATLGDVHLKLNGVLDGFKATVDNTNGLVSDARHGPGTFGTLLNDPETSARVRQAVSNAEHATESLNQTALQARQMVGDFQTRGLPEKVDESVSNVRHASEQIDQASQRVNTTLADALGPDQSGASAGQHVRETLSNVDLATANLADDTEALKHGFLFRGFFKKRGFYGLKELTPTEYRSNSFFQSSRNQRFWFSETECFTQDKSGAEVLSPEGETQIDRIIAAIKDSIVDRPLVVEGYSNDLRADRQIVLSKTHAMLIAHYLERHYSLHSTDIGTVPLNATPPSAAGKTSWDGGAIVLLTKGK